MTVGVSCGPAGRGPHGRRRGLCAAFLVESTAVVNKGAPESVAVGRSERPEGPILGTQRNPIESEGPARITAAGATDYP